MQLQGRNFSSVPVPQLVLRKLQEAGDLLHWTARDGVLTTFAGRDSENWRMGIDRLIKSRQRISTVRLC